jgi:hypothetical protein
MTRKRDHNERLYFAIEALKAAERDDRRSRLLIRREMMRLYGCSHAAAYRTVIKAAAILAGQPSAEWGGPREGAGRPPKEVTPL